MIWKESVIVPVAKVQVLNDYHLVALTSLVMKGLERIAKGSLLSVSQSVIDWLQCVYQPR